MDVADSLSFGGETLKSEKQVTKKEMPRKIIRKDFKLNEIKILKNQNKEGVANFGGNMQHIAIFNQ